MSRTTTIGLIAVTLFSLSAALWMGSHPRTIEKVKPPEVTQQASPAPAQQQIIAPVQVASPANSAAPDTVHMVFNKDVARQIMTGLQASFPVIQGAPNTMTAPQSLQAQQVMNYIANGIFKKWPDLAQKITAPVPPPVKK